MKKSLLIGSVVLVLLLGLILAACGEKGSDPIANEQKSTEQKSTSSASATPQAEAPVNLALTTVQEGGSWYVLGGIMSQTITPYLPKGSTISVVPGPGAAGNIQVVDKGDAQLGLTFNTNAAWAAKGIESYDKQYENITGLASGLGTFKMMVIARKDAPFNSLEEAVKAKLPIKLAIYKKGSGAYDGAWQILKELGVTEDNIKSWGGKIMYVDYGALKEYMINGQVDAYLGQATIGHPTINEIAVSTPLKFLPVSNEILQSVSSKYGYSIGELPGGSFKGQPDPVVSLDSSVILIANKRIPEAIANALVKGLIESRTRIGEAYSAAKGLSGETAGKNTNVSLHPGAEKYYKEAGFLK